MTNPFASMVVDATKTLDATKKKDGSLPITRAEGIALLMQFAQDPYDKCHYLESEAVLRAIARHLGEDEEYYGMLGLLHDVDWAVTKNEPKTHLTEAPDILRGAGFDDTFIEIVLSHGYGFDCAGLQDNVRTKKIEHALAAGETITGLIHAYALMRGGRVSDMDVKGLTKKFKDTSFAKGVNREIIREIEAVGISLDEFFALAIRAIADIKDIVGLA